MGSAAPHASRGGTKAPPDPPPRGQGPPDPPCAQARMVRTAREHEVIMARNMMSNHTDMQDKYCGHSNDTNPIQSQYKGNHRRGGAAVPRRSYHARLRARRLQPHPPRRQNGLRGHKTPKFKIKRRRQVLLQARTHAQCTHKSAHR